MFGNNKKTTQTDSSSSKTNSSHYSGAVNSLVAGTKIEGTVHASSDIRIDGFIEGNLQCSGKVIIGPSGKIEGEVNCENAVIEGNFSGKLFVNDVLHVKESAHIDGEVKTGQMVVDAGGVVNGSCEMVGQKVKKMKDVDKVKANVGT